MSNGPELLVDHYHKTHEIALAVWEQRNRTFLILLAIVGAATLLTFNVSQAQPLLVDVIAKLLSVENAARQQELRSSFPYGLLQSILLMVILYLTLIVYHRTTLISRTYRYLEAIEKEIRKGLALPDDAVAFTREGTFYWHHKPVLSKAVWACYGAMLGVLLFAFLAVRIYSDFTSGNTWFAAVDLVLALPTLVFYLAYVFSSAHDAFIRKLIARGKSVA